MISPDAQELAKELNDIRKRLDNIASGSRSDRLPFATIDIGKGQGGIALVDGNVIKGFLGQMPDGTVNSVSVNNKMPPPVPLAPIVVASIAGATVNARKDPDKPLPWDHSHFNVYVNDQNIGTLQLPPDSLPIGPLPYDVPTGVQLSSVNLSGTESDKTAYVYVTPLKVVGSDITDGIITDLKIANNAIKEAKIDLGAVTTTKIADDAITTPKLIANAITTEKIVANAITGEKIVINAITADKIAANAVTANEIEANAITSGKINAGAVTADKFASVINISNRFVAGNFEMNTNGLIATDGTNTIFQVDKFGNSLFAGTIRTASSGERITINESGANAIYFYTPSGMGRASIVPNGDLTYTGIQINTTSTAQLILGLVTSKISNGSSQVLLLGNSIYIGTSTSGGLRLTATTTPRAVLSANSNNTAILWNDTGLDIYNSQSGSYLAVGASAFVVQSSKENKVNIRNLKFNPIEAIKEAPAKMYEYKDDTKKLTNIGPMAEDMPDEATRIMDDESVGVNIDTKLGILWAGTEQIIKRLEKLETRLLGV